jgi:Ser/Thr protein kinase RdoA (MazF antagonist)
VFSRSGTTSGPSLHPRASGAILGQALQAFHNALADFPDPLPPLGEKLTRAAALFADPEKTPKLTASDRRLLADVYERLQLARSNLEGTSPLHGEPHEGNVLWTSDGPLFIDFEAACRGPVQWDVAYLPEEARRAFPECDHLLLGIVGR